MLKTSNTYIHYYHHIRQHIICTFTLTSPLIVLNHYHWRWVYPGLMYLQKVVCFCALHKVSVYCCILHQGVLAGQKSKMLKAICGVHIPSNLWISWADLQPFQLYGVNYWILWSGFFRLVWCSCSTLSKLSMSSGWYLGGTSESHSWVAGGLLQGLSSTSMVGSHSVGLIWVNVGLIRVSYFVKYWLKGRTWPKAVASWH